ncbi:class I SAM-dependent DNA methyltransferase [Hymenobacter sp. BRD67]|uniref:HsdM family class I SAM-dependent methyltransferase n=1 Tax=Hymenobacter sp. BRD67 TaxID=2675877 RepID=UPI0015630025|nr:class I SAM-dependent DNA methyltransferase [Hymenobacter sp. BRD67]QKG51830.1 N-6 DNA methylase [Hymenobacter sp. BRD67]
MRRHTKVSLDQLKRLLFSAADELRGSMDAAEFKDYIFGILFLKRLSDQFDQKQADLRRKYEQQDFTADEVEELVNSPTSYGETFFVPVEARWESIRHKKVQVGTVLNQAISQLEDQNAGQFEGMLKNNINFNASRGKAQARVSDTNWVAIIEKFDKYRLTNDNFEFPDLLGAAYEYLIEQFADDAGKKAGEFYTPAGVVNLMVRLLAPQPGMSVYDPTAGAGGMLIQSRQFVEEHGHDPRDLRLYGQEKSGTVWAICRMNMILHDVPDALIENGDTLLEPGHVDLATGLLQQFDRILANPPFSQNYKKADMKHQERFDGLFTPEKNKADLMFLLHMLESLKSDGMAATVMPHGVLFRGGAEQKIRQRLLAQDVLHAIISLPPGLFYGTSIPACIIVLNKKKPAKLARKALFINADAEYGPGKAMNFLRPEDAEKIVTVFHEARTETAYSRLVDFTELEADGANFNIRRYVDNTPSPEPQDVRAHLLGGLPAPEVEALRPRAAALGVQLPTFVQPRPTEPAYFDFAPPIAADRSQLRALLEADAGLHATLHHQQIEIEQWWHEARDSYARLAHSYHSDRRLLAKSRTELRHSLVQHLLPAGILSEFQLAGVFANWWRLVRDDLRTITSVGWSPSLLVEDEPTRGKAPAADDEKERPWRAPLVEARFFGPELTELARTADELEAAEATLDECLADVNAELEDGQEPTLKLVRAWLTTELFNALDAVHQRPLNLHAQHLTDAEQEVKRLRKVYKTQRARLNQFVEFKLYGIDDTDNRTALTRAQQALATTETEIQTLLAASSLLAATTPLEAALTAAQRRGSPVAAAAKALAKTRATAQKAVAHIEQTIQANERRLAEAGGIITEEEARELILQKHHNLVSTALTRYLLAEKRQLLAGLENLAEKYINSLGILEEVEQQLRADMSEVYSQLAYV